MLQGRTPKDSLPVPPPATWRALSPLPGGAWWDSNLRGCSVTRRLVDRAAALAPLDSCDMVLKV
jgi:hypothetical protein